MTANTTTHVISAVAKAIGSHEAAQLAYDTASAASAASPDDMNADEIASYLGKAESDAFNALVATPCASDAEFIEKLKCLIKREIQLFGSPFELCAEFVSVARAVERHFGESGK